MSKELVSRERYQEKAAGERKNPASSGEGY
jgi:hypothetical protein